MKKILIVGGGPSGMSAAIIAAQNGCEVHLFEKNEKLGKKLYITGKGRCNITNASDVETLLKNVVSNSKFLYSAFYSFDSDALIDFLNRSGLPTKIERGNRVFPLSDKSSDVIKTLSIQMKKAGVKIHLNSMVESVLVNDGVVCGIKLKDEKILGNAVIIATGGLSYASTGSTGDGYKFAKTMGHKVTKLFPSLVPFEVKEQWIKELQGLSLKNVQVTIRDKDKVLYEEFGEMLFTHYGLSGPLILSASAYILPYMDNKLTLSIDLKPSLDPIKLDARIVKDFRKYSRKQFKNALSDLLPAKLIPVIISLSGISPEKKVDQISKEERHRVVTLLKGLACTVSGTRDYNEAIITRGGIMVKEVNPNTMESKLVKNVYFIGEVLDLDALTGGYNLQIAWSTGYLAGLAVSDS